MSGRRGASARTSPLQLRRRIAGNNLADASQSAGHPQLGDAVLLYDPVALREGEREATPRHSLLVASAPGQHHRQRRHLHSTARARRPRHLERLRLHHRRAAHCVRRFDSRVQHAGAVKSFQRNFGFFSLFCDSCSSIFTYAIAASDLGADTVHAYVGQESSGRLFKEICLDSVSEKLKATVNSRT